MDKKIILAVAGSGKTTQIIKDISIEKRNLIITYTVNNYENLKRKIIEKYKGSWPQNVRVMTYFSFLYNFCYKPFLSDVIMDKGIDFDTIPSIYLKKTDIDFCVSPNNKIYSRRLAYLLEQQKVIDNVMRRIEKYFDYLYIDEVQDFAGRDFDFLEHIMDININMLFTGDFYQHTYDTSRDGSYRKKLHDNYQSYCSNFISKGFILDTKTLSKSYRCSLNVCNFITNELGILINSRRDDSTTIEYVSDLEKIKEIVNNKNIIKLHYDKGYSYGIDHRNWGESKGEDHYMDVCVMLNNKSDDYYKKHKLKELPISSKNKLYVAITRAHGNVYFVCENIFLKEIKVN